MEREGFVFYKSFWDAIQEIDDEHTRLLALEAITSYGLTGEDPDLPRGAASMIFKMAKPQLEANYKRFVGGSRGGAPKGNQNAKKTTEKQPKQPEVVLDNNHRLNEKQPKEKEKEKEKEKVKEREDPTPALGEFRNVILSKDQEEKLAARYGKQQTDKYVERLSAYMESHKTKYKSHYAVLLQWMSRDQVPETGAGSQSDLYNRALEQLTRRASV